MTGFMARSLGACADTDAAREEHRANTTKQRIGCFMGIARVEFV